MQRNSPVVPLQVDALSAMKIAICGSMVHERILMGRKDVWHKVTVVRGARYDQEFVLKTILNAVDPEEFLPVRYQVSGEDTYFIVCDCGAALEKLCRSNLILTNSEGDPLVIRITLGFSLTSDLKFNAQTYIWTTFSKRYDSKKKVLHLDAFHNDKLLSSNVYYPLSYMKNFNNILKLVRSKSSYLQALNLRSNHLDTLAPLQTLSFLKCLDVRYNDLMDMEILKSLAGLRITELWLDGNPLCENYSGPKQYIESARSYCPLIIKLDGVYIGAPGMPLMYNNYFKHWNLRNLVAQFLTHFFTLYDCEDRSVLTGLYHKDAIYSMTFGDEHLRINDKSIERFVYWDRNLLKSTDFTKYDNLFVGHDEVLAGIRKLPRSYHDKSTFCHDVIYADDDRVVLTVEGLFKNFDAKAQILSFNRTFVLAVRYDDEYNIVNDQYHVNYVPAGQNIEITEDAQDLDPPCVCLSETEKEHLITTFASTTTLNHTWCEQYLEEVNWDIRKAILNFMERYRSTRIPLEAFQKKATDC